MPELDLTSEDFAAGRSREVLVRVEARMLWPDDDNRHARALEAGLVDARIDLLARKAEMMPSDDVRTSGKTIGWSLLSEFTPAMPVEVDVRFLRRLAKATPLSEIEDDLRNRWAKGARVGAMLVEVLGATPRAWRKKSQLPSMTELRTRYAKIEDPVVGKIGEKTLQNAWKEFQPVAHLWAAAFVRGYTYETAGVDDEPLPISCLLGDLENFLGLAEAFRVVGEARKFKGGSGKGEFVLNSGETWRLPEGLPVPVSKWTGRLNRARREHGV